MVELVQHENTLKLTVCDDGTGLPEGLDLNRPKSLGLTLIRTLTSQLKGTCSFTNNGQGTLFQLQFEAD
jgi:two-component sensor histidine kinase